MVSKNLPVCLWSTLTPSISGLAEQIGQKKFRTFMSKTCLKFFFVRKGASRARAEGQNDLSFNQNQIPFEKVCNFFCQSCFGKPFFCCCFFLQKQLIYDFLAGNNSPDLPHLQGVWNLPHKFHLYLIIIIIWEY